MRLRRARLCASLALAASMALGACATRPVTEGITGQTSYRIAQSIRCEMRDSVIYLLSRRLEDVDGELAARLNRDSLSSGNEFNEADLLSGFLSGGYKRYGDKSLDQIIEAYAKTYVAYNFTFDITIDKNLGGGIDLLSTLSRGTLKAPITASFDGKRHSKREFVLGDRFEELLTNIPTIRECNRLRSQHASLRNPNHAYPIAGKLNLVEVVQNFFSLNQSANLVGNAAGDVLPTQSDTLIFTTTVGATAEANLELMPLRRSTEVSAAGFDFGLSRVDVHSLVLSMNLPKQGMLTVAQKRSATDSAAYQRQQAAAIIDLERQRVRDIEDENSRLRLFLLGRP